MHYSHLKCSEHSTPMILLTKITFLLCLLTTMLFMSSASALETHVSSPELSKDQAQQLINVLEDNSQRQQFLTTLKNITQAQTPQPELSLVEQTLNNLSLLGDKFLIQIHILHQNVLDFASIAPWLHHLWNNPDLIQNILSIFFRTTIMIAGCALLFFGARLILRRPYQILSDLAQKHDQHVFHEETHKLHHNNQPSETDEHVTASSGEEEYQTIEERLRRQGALVRLVICLRRTPYTLATTFLDLISVLMFPLMALIIQSMDPAPNHHSTHTIWSIAWLAGIGLGVWCTILRALLSPTKPWFRLTILRDKPAHFFYKYLRFIGFILAWGYTSLIILRELTLPLPVFEGLLKILALIIHILIAIMILRARQFTHTAARQASARNKRVESLIRLLSHSWWIVALFFDGALWLVWAANISGGYEIILRLFLRTCAALILMRILNIIVYGGLERFIRSLERWNLNKETQLRIRRYYPATQALIRLVMGLTTILALAIAWGAPIYLIFGQHTLGTEIINTIITLLVALIIGVITWECANVIIEHHIRRLGEHNSKETRLRMARLKTLQPMFRILLLLILTVIIGLTVLSQLGINTAPLLASASIFGVAIGFGSQKLVQDFISGIFLLFENALTVGDAVTLNGTYGVVEKLSLRSVHVRANDGSMNIFSFSSLGQVTNYNRDFSRAMISAVVNHKTNTDEVVIIMQDIAKELRHDPEFKDLIIDNFDLWGVSALNDSSVTIQGVFPTTTAGRWPVEWQFNRRLKKRFEEKGIQFPSQSLEIYEKNLSSSSSETQTSPHPKTTL